MTLYFKEYKLIKHMSGNCEIYKDGNLKARFEIWPHDADADVMQRTLENHVRTWQQLGLED